jgi:hypothetical protein
VARRLVRRTLLVRWTLEVYLVLVRVGDVEVILSYLFLINKCYVTICSSLGSGFLVVAACLLFLHAAVVGLSAKMRYVCLRTRLCSGLD